MRSKQPVGAGIVSLPYERNHRVPIGTRHAPEMILEDLANMDTFDMYLGLDPIAAYPRRFVTAHSRELIDPLIQQTISATAVNELLLQDLFVVGLGGERSVTIGPVLAASTHGPLGVVQMDAGANLRSQYHGTPFHPFCVMRRVAETGNPICCLGVQALTEEEQLFVSTSDIPFVSADEFQKQKVNWRSLLSRMPERIYLSVNMNYFHQGPSWEETVSFLEQLFRHHRVVCADISGFSPGSQCLPMLRMASRMLALLIGFGMR